MPSQTAHLAHLPKRLIAGAFLFTLILLVTVTSQTQAQTNSGQAQPHPQNYRDLHGQLPEHQCDLTIVPHVHNSRAHMQLSSQLRAARAQPTLLAPTSDIQVNYVGPWDPNAKTALEFAVSIWESILESSVPILVTANWSSLGPSFGANAGPENYMIDFDNAPVANTWYPVATANALAGRDLDPGFDDIGATFNSDFTDWYFGTDGAPADKLDFVTIALHELGHGLGFLSSIDANISAGTANWGAGSNSPDIYDLFVKNGANQQLISAFPNQSAALFGQVTSNDIWFDGPQTKAQNSGNRARLYAPTNWISAASSIGHLDETTYNGTTDAIMTPEVGFGEVFHTIGPITLGMMADVGWKLNPNVNTPPTFSDSSYVLEQGSSVPNAVDLWAHVADNSHDASLTFAITNGSSSTSISGNNIQATLSGNRYLSVTATGVGLLTVNINVSDPDGTSDSATVAITAVQQLSRVYLPVLVK